MPEAYEIPAPPPWASELTTVGVTGTNGKTTTTLLVGAALGGAGPMAVVTTLGAQVGDERAEPLENLRSFVAVMEKCHRRGGRKAAIELTSEALGRGFALAWPCAVGVFTNLTRDHLDAHGSPEHYLASKAQLFMHLPEGGAAVLNAADPASELLDEVVPSGVRRIRYAVPSRGGADQADLWAASVSLDWERGTEVSVVGSHRLHLRVRALGEVFAENALAALGAAMGAGIAPERAAERIAAVPPPPGRFEVVGGPPHTVIDYAHTPDALRRTLATARSLTSGRVLVVFGAGGERDQAKRPLMGKAARGADRIILTSDNPRSEDPRAIADAIFEGLGGHGAVDFELDRGAAIALAMSEARPEDVVVVAGRGHEDAQVVAGEERPFSDADVARAFLEA